MLKVSRKSWHYRLWKVTHPHSEPKNLCRYFWLCVLSIVVPLIVFFLALAGIGTLLYLVATNLETVAFGIGFILGVVLIGMALVAFLKWQGRNIAKGITAGTVGVVVKAKKKEPGLVRSFIRAKKQKVCPMIEVTD